MKLKAGSTPWRPFRCLKMLRGGWVIQEGTAVGFLLVWCGRSTTTLVAAGHSPNKFWGKNELVFLTWKWCDSTLDLSTLKTLYKRIRELAMDGELNFRGTGCTIRSVSIFILYYKEVAEAGCKRS
ncbi:hypothetical protein [Shewanella frigidimarina]|uniref:hypothetical protein n=1 Tax=Shewanella frigidimarina TaxID=56812 RepID=UPI003D7BA5A9